MHLFIDLSVFITTRSTTRGLSLVSLRTITTDVLPLWSLVSTIVLPGTCKPGNNINATVQCLSVRVLGRFVPLCRGKRGYLL